MYKFLSITTISKIIFEMASKGEYNIPIDFTLDTKETADDPSGWFGIELLNILDNNVIAIAYYGGCYPVYTTTVNNDDTLEDFVNDITDMIDINICDADSNSELLVDVNDEIKKYID